MSRLRGLATTIRTMRGGSSPGRWLAAAAVALVATLPGAVRADAVVFRGDDNLPPYEYLQDGVAKGLNVEFLQALGAAIGRPVEIRLGEWRQAQDDVLAGRGDALTLMVPSDERRALYDFTSPTFLFRFTFFVRAEERTDFGESPLAGRRIGVTAGGLPNTYLRAHHPDATLIEVRDNTDGMRRVQRREIDAFAASEEAGSEFLRELRVSGIAPVARPFLVREGAIAVPKGNPGLLAQLEAGVVALRSDGTFDRIIARLDRDRVLIFSSRELLLALTAAAAVLVVLVLLAALLIVTRRERRRLAEREAQLRATFAGVADAIVSIRSDGQVLDLNQAFADLHGFTAPEAARQRLDRLVEVFETRRIDGDPIAVAERPVMRALRGETVWNEEFEIRRRATGEFCFYGSYNAVPVFGADGTVDQVVVTIHDITERVRSDRRQALLTSEVDHRARNALAVVQAVVRMTRADSIEGFAEAVCGRVETLARSHARLSQSRWLPVDLTRLVSDELAAFTGDRPDRIAWDGPALELDALAVQPFSMILHELATNASKYGALSVPSGQVTVAWRSTPAGGLEVDWRETDGPPVESPARSGVGTSVITGSVRQLAGSVRFDWRRTGLLCAMGFPPAAIRSRTGRSDPPRPPEQDRAAPGSLAGRRILVVEDEALLAAQLVRHLQEIGCVAIGPAATLPEALRLAASEAAIDAAVLDINIGGRPSWTVADVLAERGIPFIFASGYASTDKVVRRDAEVMQKPFTREALAQALHRLLGIPA